MVNGSEAGLLDKVMNALRQYGLAKTLGAIGIIALFIWALNSENTIDRIINDALDKRTEVGIQEENVMMNQRESVQDDIYKILHNIIDDTDADRAFIFEMHNGTNNTSGLPFMYAEMTYEEVKHGIMPVAEDWGKLTMTLYNFPIFIKQKGYWEGSLDDMKDLDYKIGLKSEANDVKYMYMCTLYGVRENCLGALGITFVNKDKSENPNKVRQSMMIHAQQVAILLDTAVKEIN